DRVFTGLGQLSVTLVGDLLQAAQVGAGARRDQAADDDVFLQAFQRVLLPVDRSLGQDAGGLLERGRRDEAAGLQRRLGDAQQDRLHGGDAAAALLDLG